jgi:hypothetical protein
MGKIVDAIDAAVLAGQEQGHRAHLGCSGIGEECARKIWYSFRWTSQSTFAPNTLRLFERGHLEEDRFVKWLRAAGVEVFQNDPNTGRQFRFKGYKGHVGGEIDGVGIGIISDQPYLLEFKTHNEKSFKELQANGVEMSKPIHYVQMQMYMGQYQLPRALYLAIDKNSDRLYDEVVEFNRAIYDKYLARAQMIVDAPEPPPRLSNNPTWFECKWCDHHAVCHLKAAPLKNCRTCAHSTPVEDGEWQCEFPPGINPIPEELMVTGCPIYYQHPME